MLIRLKEKGFLFGYKACLEFPVKWLHYTKFLGASSRPLGLDLICTYFSGRLDSVQEKPGSWQRLNFVLFYRP